MSKKTKKKEFTLIDLVKSARKVMPPKGKTFKVEKKVIPRKKKYKEKYD